MALDIFSTFATDEKLEVEGAWKDIGDGTSLLIGRANNVNYLTVFTELYSQNAELMQLASEKNAPKDVREVGDAKAREITIECLAKTILLGWKNLVYKGKPLKYSVENATMLLQHKDFRALVSDLSGDVNNYRMKLEEDQQKN